MGSLAQLIKIKHQDNIIINRVMPISVRSKIQDITYIMSNSLENGAFVWKLDMNIVYVSETSYFLASYYFNSSVKRLPLRGWLPWLWNCLLCTWRLPRSCRMQTICLILGSTIANLFCKFLYQRCL